MSIITKSASAAKKAKRGLRKSNHAVKGASAIVALVSQPTLPADLATKANAAHAALTDLQTALNSYIHT